MRLCVCATLNAIEPALAMVTDRIIAPETIENPAKTDTKNARRRFERSHAQDRMEEQPSNTLLHPEAGHR